MIDIKKESQVNLEKVCHKLMSLLIGLIFWCLIMPYRSMGNQAMANLGCNPFEQTKVTVDKSLSPFWAQEYTGSDLVRLELQNIMNDAFFIQENLLEIWDSSKNNHGHYVSSMMIGPHQGATIPSDWMLGIFNIKKEKTIPDSTQANWEEMTHNLESLVDGVQNPLYVNFSMGLAQRQDWAELLVKAHQRGATIVMAAGNQGLPLDEFEEKIGRDDHVILVSHLDTDGLPHADTNLSDHTTISAPSSFEINAMDFYHESNYNEKGLHHEFGGSSGAAPQVSVALAVFTLLTEYYLDVQEAKHLLKATALPYAFIPTPNRAGHGLLNTYKIFHWAKNISKVCDGHFHCIKNNIVMVDKYLPKLSALEKSQLEEAKNEFASCFEKNHNDVDSDLKRGCEKKKNALRMIRKSSFLTLDPKLFKGLECIAREYHYEKNAQFYNGVFKALTQSMKEMIDGLEEMGADQELSRLRENFF